MYQYYVPWAQVTSVFSPDCRTQEAAESSDIPHLRLEDTELLPREYITSPEVSENLPDHISQGSDHEGMQNSNDLFGVSGDDLMRSRDLDISQRDTTNESLDITKDSPHKAMGRMLAQHVTEEALRDEMEEGTTISTFQELQILLTDREQVSLFYRDNIIMQRITYL